MKNEKITVIMVDDHPLIRSGFARDIEEDDSLMLIDEAKDGKEGLEKITGLKPDIAIIDIELPELNGLELSRKVKIESPETEIVILTGHPHEEYFNEAMEIGVSGYFLKDETGDLVNAIKKIYGGETVLSPKVHGIVAKIYKKRSRFNKNIPDVKNLTPRELEILKLISENKTNSDISSLLNIEKRTVETHRNNIREKLGLIGKGSNALLVYALQNNVYLNS